jgi:hypothetical protein
MRTILVVVTLVLAGCDPPRYAYRPTPATARTDAPATVDGHQAARYPLPLGQVDVTTIGLADGMVHVRMVVHNRDSGPWTVVPSEQEATVGDAELASPRRALCDGANVAAPVLEAGETRTFDLYYDVPSAQPHPKTPPAVRVDWRVRTPSAVLARASSGFDPYQVRRPAPPPPDPHKLARALDAPPREGVRDRGAALPPPGRGDLAGGLGH